MQTFCEIFQIILLEFDFLIKLTYQCENILSHFFLLSRVITLHQLLFPADHAVARFLHRHTLMLQGIFMSAENLICKRIKKLTEVESLKNIAAQLNSL